MSCCGSLFVNLGGGGGGTIADGVLQTPTALTNSLQIVKDNLGNNSAAQLSKLGFRVNDGTNDIIDFLSAQIRAYRTIEIGQGSLTNNGFLTVKGAGSNIASFRDSSNVEVAFITNSGQITTPDARISYLQLNGGTFYINGRGYINFPSDGITLFSNDALNGYTRQQFGGSTSSFPAFSFTNTLPTIAAKDATGTNLIPFSAEHFTSENLSSGTLTTARSMQFGDKGTISDVGLSALGLTAQIAVEHNGSVYYIPCSTSLIS
jgi:hypothetical protein